MRDESVARNYAEALLELADRHEGAEAYGDWIETVGELIGKNQRLAMFLNTPRIDSAAKKEVLKSALGDSVPSPFLNFLLITIDKRRQRLLPIINDEFQKLVDDRMDRERVQVTIARDIGSDEEARLTSYLTRLLGHTALPQIRVRPEIIGGVVVKSGDRIYNGSVQHRMKNLRRQLLKTEL